MCLKEFKSKYNKDTMFTAVLFTVVKLWKQPRYPTTAAWFKKMLYMYTMEYNSAIKKNEILSFTGKWMELENIMLNEARHVQKDKNHVFSHMWKIDPNTSIIICICIHTQNMFPKVGWRGD
jgi:hypothetical protein